MRKAIFSALVMLAMTLGANAGNPKVVAHRGYWTTEGSAQNSIRSLVKADSIGIYGSEFDVWLTSDDHLVVFHDAKIGDMVLEDTPFDKIRAHKLANGECVPTLDEYLKAATKLKTRLVFELKSHKNKAQEAKAVDMLLKAVEKHKLTKRVDYITFSLPGMVRLLQKAPKGTPVYYLADNLSPEDVKEMGCTGLDCSMGVFRKHPDYLERSHKLGLKVNVWTVNSREDLQWCIDQGFDFITTNEPVLLRDMLKK